LSATDHENAGTLWAATAYGMGVRCGAGACDARQTRTDGQTNTRARAIWDAIILTLQSAAAEAGLRRIRSVVVRARARSSGTKNVNQLVVVAAAATMLCRGQKNTIPPNERREIGFFLHGTRSARSVGRVCARFLPPRVRWRRRFIVWTVGGDGRRRREYATFADPRPQRCLPPPLNFCHVRLIIIIGHTYQV